MKERIIERWNRRPGADTYNRGDLNGYTAEEIKEAGEAVVKGFLDGLSLSKRLNKLEE